MKLASRLLLTFSVLALALRAQDTIKVGEYASLTGKEASFGQQSHKGLTLAIEELNAAGGVRGRRVEIITRDTQGDPTKAVNATQEMISELRVHAIWGPTIEAAPQKMFPRILDRFRAGAQVSATDYITARRRLTQLRAIFADRTGGFDAVLVPTSAILPPNAKRLMTDDAYYVSENLLALRNTRIGNLMDQCVLTLPTGHPSCGLSLMSAPRTEARLLRLGQAAERALA